MNKAVRVIEGQEREPSELWSIRFMLKVVGQMDRYPTMAKYHILDGVVFKVPDSAVILSHKRRYHG